ncbi:MAG: P-loop NTPase fold protein [Hyphomicrobiales bacterium]
MASTIFVAVILFILYYGLREPLDSVIKSTMNIKAGLPSQIIEISLALSALMAFTFIFKRKNRAKIPDRINLLLIPFMALLIIERFFEKHYNQHTSNWLTKDFIPIDIFFLDYIIFILALIIIINQPFKGVYMAFRKAFIYIKDKAKKDSKTLLEKIEHDAPITPEEFKKSKLDYATDYPHQVQAEQTLEKIRNSFNEDNALSIAIEGGWGSGKTTFINYLKYLDKKDSKSKQLEWIDVEVFRVSRPENIRQYFFSCLERKLSQFVYVGSSIKKYVNSLDKITKYSSLRIALAAIKDTVISYDDNSEPFKKIKDKVLQSNKQYVITIDDLDRLERDEVIEVFKIIRSSGNFGNCIFLLPMDRENVIKIMAENDKDKRQDVTEYIKKFIQCNIVLNDISPIQYTEFIINKVKDENAEKYFTIKSETYNFLCASKLQYRQCKIIVNEYSNTLQLFKDKLPSGWINTSKEYCNILIILSCLKYLYPKTYSYIKENYTIAPFVNTIKKDKKDSLFLDEGIKDILKAEMFKVHNNSHNNSIEQFLIAIFRNQLIPLYFLGNNGFMKVSLLQKEVQLIKYTLSKDILRKSIHRIKTILDNSKDSHKMVGIILFISQFHSQTNTISEYQKFALLYITMSLEKSPSYSKFLTDAYLILEYISDNHFCQKIIELIENTMTSFEMNYSNNINRIGIEKIYSLLYELRDKVQSSKESEKVTKYIKKHQIIIDNEGVICIKGKMRLSLNNIDEFIDEIKE